MEEKYKKLPIYELIIDDETDTGISKISLVTEPAIEVNWVAFSEDKPKASINFKIQSADKRILTGPFMIPDQPIYRIDPKTGEEYYVVISKESIFKAVNKFFKNNRATAINAEHSTDVPGCTVIESWFVSENNDKSKTFGYDLPEGSWFGSIYIEDEKMWNEYIKSGKLGLHGFSVEGAFFLNKTVVKTFKKDVKKDNDLWELAEILANYKNK